MFALQPKQILPRQNLDQYLRGVGRSFSDRRLNIISIETNYPECISSSELTSNSQATRKEELTEHSVLEGRRKAKCQNGI